MFDYTSKDTTGLYAPRKEVQNMLHPVYSHSSALTVPRPAWHEDKPRYYRWRLNHMSPGDVQIIDGVEAFRKKTSPRWWIEGVEYKLDAAVGALTCAVAKKYPLPFFKLSPLQKKVLRYWLTYEHENGIPPYLSAAATAMHRSFQCIGDQLTTMAEWDVVYRDDHQGGEKDYWHVNLDRIKLVNLEE